MASVADVIRRAREYLKTTENLNGEKTYLSEWERQDLVDQGMALLRDESDTLLRYEDRRAILDEVKDGFEGIADGSDQDENERMQIELSRVHATIASESVIEIGEYKIPGLGPPPAENVNQMLIDSVMGGFTQKPKPPDAYDQLRSRDMELAANPNEKVAGASFGELTYLYSGLGNIDPSAAVVAEAAKYSERVVVIFGSPPDSGKEQLMPLDEIGGVPLPKHARGKVWGFGEPKHALLTWEQSHDRLAEAIDAIAEDGEDVLGIDPLVADATLIAHSQGGLAGIKLRHELEAVGLDHVIGSLITVGTPFGGGVLVDTLHGQGWISGARNAAGEQGAQAMSHLSPTHVKPRLEGIDPGLVDLSLYGDVGASQSNQRDPVIRDGLDFYGRQITTNWQIQKSDGIVAAADATFDAEGVQLPGHRDHILMWELGETIRTIAEQLGQAEDEDDYKGKDED
jgi:hypothetical protein